ncbi:MAG: tetratricopeptide repeat protein [Mediterranea sp.]|jgi:tetratricopeptide (TPR) repeat protein|nr:tetratricopeptide repeat protein [Mediterranea sp.]
MINKNLLSGREKELHEMAEQFEAAMAKGESVYMDSENLADLSDWYATRGNMDNALKVVRLGLEMHPDNITLLVEYAYLLIDTFQDEEAHTIIERMTGDNTPKVIVLRATMAMNEGKDEEALAIIEGLKENEELELDDVSNIIFMLINSDYPDDAKQWIDILKKEYSDKELYTTIMADYLFSQAEYAEATEWYNKLIDINPYSASYWMGLARCHYHLNEIDKAIDACNYALIGDDDYSPAFFLKGICFFQLGNMKASMECFLHLKADPTYQPSTIDMHIGMCYYGESDWENAYSYLEKALREGSFDGELTLNQAALYMHIAVCLCQLGRKDEAKPYWEKAYELDPNNVAYHIIRGRIYMEEGEEDKAVDEWKCALQCTTDIMKVWDEIGMHCIETGNMKMACSAYEFIYSRNPDFDKIHQKLMIVYLALHDEEKLRFHNAQMEHPIAEDILDGMQNILSQKDSKESATLLKRFLDSL